MEKAQAEQRAFFATLSDVDGSDDDSACSSDDESEKKKRIEDKLNGLCFFADDEGFCTMALGKEVDGELEDTPRNDDDDDDTSQVSQTPDELSAEVEKLTAALLSQDKLLRRAARERKEFRQKWEDTVKELESVKSTVVVTEEDECEMCTTHMTDLLTLRGKYAALVGEVDELKARPSLLGACKSCAGLQSELAEKNAKIVSLEKASSDSTCVSRCTLCEGLEMEIANVKHDKMQTEEENTYLRTILSWVSCSEPQLGMMISQFKRAVGAPGVGFAQSVDLSGFGKIGESSGLNPCEKPNSTTTPKLAKLPLKEPAKPITQDGVVEETPR
ncbi:hypothetical protein, partial [Haemophilus sp. SZY H53]